MITWTSSDTGLTAAAPTLSSQGADLTGVEGFRIIVSCPSGITFDLTTGTPQLLFYVYSPTKGRWILNPTLTRTLSTTDAAGGRDMVLEDAATFVPFGRLYVAQSGLTVSSGTVIESLVVEGWRP